MNLIVWSPGDLLLRFSLSYSPSVWSEILHLSLCQKTEKQNKQSCSSSLVKTPVAVWVHVWVCVCARLPFCFWRMSRVSGFTDVNKTNNFVLLQFKKSLWQLLLCCARWASASARAQTKRTLRAFWWEESVRGRGVSTIFTTLFSIKLVDDLLFSVSAHTFDRFYYIW